MHNNLVKQKERKESEKKDIFFNFPYLNSNEIEDDNNLQLPQAPATTSYGEDSLEIAPTTSNDESVEVDDLIFDQSDLAEHILAAEKKFSTSSIHTATLKQSIEYFEYPALYRILFMGSTTEELKKQLFKKLSQGFIHVLQQQPKNLSFLGQPIIPFKEIKHNLVLLDDEEPNLVSDTFEDIGVSMIEADFTWNSNAVNYSNDANNLLLQYAWYQCPNPRELPTAWLEQEIFSPTATKFIGSMYPEQTPNGIDLCVYFYDGPTDEERTKNDLELLCLLRKLGIYVLPLTTTRNEQTKSHFADLLTKYKVRCLDLGNLEVGQEPSFFHQQKEKETDRITRLQGMECTQLNVPRVATYQILAVDQFCGIENKAIFQLLKRTRERQVIRDEFKEELARLRRLQQQESRNNNDEGGLENSIDSFTSSNSSSSSRSAGTSNDNDSFSNNNEKKKETSSNGSKLLRWGLMSIISLFILFLPYQYYTIQQQLQQQQWSVSFNIESNFQFTMNTRDATGNSTWPINTPPPQVWLNHNTLVPISKISDKPGYYQLLVDPLSTMSTRDRFISLVFSVNATNTITYTSLTNSSPTFILLNSNYNSSHILTKEKEATKKQDPIVIPVTHQQQQHDITTRDKTHIIAKSYWDTFRFLQRKGLSDIYNLMIRT